MFCGTNEDRVKHIRNKIDDLRLVTTVYPDVKAVIQEFDGKVYNKRLGEALNERLKDKGYIYTHKNERGIEISANMKKDGYYPYRSHRIAWILLEKLTDGKRINADVFIESLTEYRESLLKEANELEKGLQVIEGVKAQLDSLIDTYRKIYRTIPSAIQDTWNIKHI